MGNGPGGLREYQDLFEAHPRLAGGFVWEWIDHGIEQMDADGTAYYAYGGDFGEELHDGNFVADGLIFPDRTPSPGLIDFKKVVEPVRVAVDPARQTITVSSLHHTRDTGYLRWGLGSSRPTAPRSPGQCVWPALEPVAARRVPGDRMVWPELTDSAAARSSRSGGARCWRRTASSG